MGGIAQVLTTIARGRGFTLEDVSEEVERRGGYASGEAMRVIKEEYHSCPMLCPLLTDILDLTEVEEHMLHNAIMDSGNRWWRVLRVTAYEDAVS